METKICAASISRMAKQIFNTKSLEYLAATHRRSADLARQQIPTYRARVGDRLHATLFQRRSSSAKDMSSNREENLGKTLWVANDVQAFVDTNTKKTRYVFCIVGVIVN